MWTECASERPKRRRTHYQAQAVLLSLGGAGSVCSYSATHVFCLSHLFSFLSFFHPFLSLSFLQTCSLPHKYVRTKHPQGGCGLRGGTEGGCGCKGTLSACVRVLTLCLVVQIGAYRTHTYTHALTPHTQHTHTTHTHTHTHTLEDTHTHTPQHRTILFHWCSSLILSICVRLTLHLPPPLTIQVFGYS